jgi:hypothetical protein
VSYFTWLEKEVARAIARKRIGTPVSLRAFFHLSADHGRLVGALAEALAAAGAWLASSPVRLYARGGVRAGEITAMVEYAGGQTALVSAAVLRNASPLADVLLIGNRGTLRYQDHPEPGEPGRPDARLWRAIEASLAAGAPVEVGN